ncbi:unnamed protein product [Ranitomeya imitator]|uniref:Receptor ligand binding region domain-containing protein n=1 Tax=Ranitomeya imitator TaxID=111125 RepID=A0ABN9MNV8_9NEOB|nr:unnamed protein product [Ranitomeya imitator]
MTSRLVIGRVTAHVTAHTTNHKPRRHRRPFRRSFLRRKAAGENQGTSEALRLLYDEPNSVDQAEKILLALCQGQEAAESYCQKFRKWSVLTKWNEDALAAIFRKGLSESVKDVMVGFPTPAGLSDSMSLAIQIDRRLRERRVVHTVTLSSERSHEPMQTVSSDVFQSKALAQLILHFGWTWIGLLALESDYGQEGIQLVRKEIVKAGACVAFTETIITRRPDRNAPHIVNILKQSSARVVVVFCRDIDLFPILMEMVKQDVAQLIFVASEALATSTFFQGMSASLVMGMIGVALNSGTIPGLQNFLNKVHPSMPLGGKWAKILWELALIVNLSRRTLPVL